MTVEVRALLIVTAEDDGWADLVLRRVREARLAHAHVVVVEQSRELVDE